MRWIGFAGKLLRSRNRSHRFFKFQDSAPLSQLPIVKVSVRGAVCFLASVASTVKLAGAPAAVAFFGLPEMMPFVGLSVKPAGNLLPEISDHLNGAMPVPGVTRSVAVYDFLAVAFTRLVVARCEGNAVASLCNAH